MFTDESYDKMLHEIEAQQKLDQIYKLVKLMVSGQDTFIIDYPNYGDLKVSIVSINFDNIFWKPIVVFVLDDVQEEYNTTEIHDFIGEINVVKKRKVTTTSVQLDWFKL